VPAIEHLVTPADRSGIQLHYRLMPLRTATVVLLDANGGPVAAGTRIRRPEGSAIVGYGGELWLEHYADGETLQWSHAGQGCRVTLPPLPAAATPCRGWPAERGHHDTMTLARTDPAERLLVLPWMATPARAQSCSSGTTATLDFGNIAANPTVQTDVTGTLN
jgi:hypothetical protein